MFIRALRDALVFGFVIIPPVLFGAVAIPAVFLGTGALLPNGF